MRTIFWQRRGAAKLARWGITLALCIGLVQPAAALTWDAKLRGKLVFIALLGGLALGNEWLLHRDQQQYFLWRERLGKPRGTFTWNDGFDRWRLERYERGAILLNHDYPVRFIPLPLSPSLNGVDP